MSPGDREHALSLVLAARRWIGTPYVHQASLCQVGCDCLGLVRGVWREVIGAEPEQPGPYTPDWAESSRDERMLRAALRYFTPRPNREIEAGDILLFRWRANAPAKHVAIASSATSMIHAHDGACVCEVALTPFWKRKLAGVFVFPARLNG